MQFKFKNALQSKFAKRSKVLFLGTFMSQAITFVTSFVIVAFYTPEALGLLGTLGALISIIAGTLSFRLELAVIQSNKEQSSEVFLKSTVIGGIACTAFAIFCIFLPWDFADKIRSYFVLFIFWSWGYCIFFNSRQLPFRFDELKYVSFGGIWRSFFILLAQLIAGLTNPTFTNLIIGRVSGDYIGAIPHLWKYIRKISFKSLFTGWRKFIRVHSDFFLFITPHHLCLALSSNILILFLEQDYGLMIVGFFALAQRLIQAPIELIGSTMQNVTIQRFGELKENREALKTFYLKIVALSGVVAIFLGALIFALAPVFIPFLGVKWIPAIEMVQSMVPYFVSTIFISPTIFILRFINQARLQLLLEIVELISKLGILIFVQWGDFLSMVLGYGILSLVFSLLKTIIVFKQLSTNQDS